MLFLKTPTQYIPLITNTLMFFKKQYLRINVLYISYQILIDRLNKSDLKKLFLKNQIELHLQKRAENYDY